MGRSIFGLGRDPPPTPPSPISRPLVRFGGKRKRARERGAREARQAGSLQDSVGRAGRKRVGDGSI